MALYTFLSFGYLRSAFVKVLR